MTSVRVRRRGYSTLGDTDISPTVHPSNVSRRRARSDTGLLLSPPLNVDTEVQRPLPHPHQLHDGNRVSRCVQESSLRSSFLRENAERHRRITSIFSSPTSPTSPSDGSQNDVRLEDQHAIHERGPLRRVSSSHDLRHDYSEESTDDDEHPDDDIIENLDVIGTQALLLTSNLSLTVTTGPGRSSGRYGIHPRKRGKFYPHVRALFYHICCAVLTIAQSPPVSLYSRKPVVILPERPRRDEETAFEAGTEDELDRHVKDVLTRPSPTRRILRGVWSFLKTPIGIIAGIYGFLVIFWGAGLVLILVKIINFHNYNTQQFWVEVASQIENGLFCVTGIGLLPWRVQDTYRESFTDFQPVPISVGTGIYKIWYYKRRTRILRKQTGLPELYDPDDLPDPMYDENFVHVLKEHEQADLHYQQRKFMRSQTWYRPHGTETHRAFPINKALLICCLNDGNSIFQIMLAGTMWGLNRFTRPAWSTGLLIPASFICGIASGVVIWRGSQKTRRTKLVEGRLRRALGIDDGMNLPSPSSSMGTNGHTEPQLLTRIGTQGESVRVVNSPTGERFRNSSSKKRD
ncbi:hypothetical protein EW146_g9425 [Bondarzewia mesenterica]|uniref:Uncharacterized protein n=1 Tax=Bondarzewia mesenterica TaxID=1095465 RepID=A0A4S4L6E7_9AGAM|nr:hypothetical protein EW146_g9425 [Bondarzewia mesenterica]